MIVEAGVERFEAPMPPKLPLEQVTKCALSLARGEPNREPIVLTILADNVRERIEGCDEFRGFGVGRATWADTELPRSAKPGGPARSGC